MPNMQSDETAGAIANYSKIAEALRSEIRAGVYSDEGSFPSLTKIMQRFGVSRPSAVRSVAELKRLGLVTTRKGAGTFVSQRNRTIGLAIPGTADSEFFSAIMDGLVFNCNKYGMDLVAGDIFAVDHDERAKQAERLARHFASVGVAGVIMQPVGFSENANQLNGIIADILDKAGIPVVLVDYDIATPPGRSKYDLVAIDNLSAGRKVAAHLLKVGAKRICCLRARGVQNEAGAHLCSPAMLRDREHGVQGAFGANVRFESAAARDTARHDSRRAQVNDTAASAETPRKPDFSVHSRH